MKAYERFLKYVAVWTASDENSKSVPTTKRQLDLGALLVEEMKALGLSDVKMMNMDMCMAIFLLPRVWRQFRHLA